MQDLDQTIIYSHRRYQQASNQNVNPEKNSQQDSQENFQFFREIETYFLQDSSLSKIDQLYPFQSNEEIYSHSQNLIQDEIKLNLPQQILEELKLIENSHTQQIPFFSKIFQNLICIVMNNTLFFWDFLLNTYQKLQFQERISGLDIGNPNEQIFFDVQKILIITLEKQIMFYEIKIIMQQLQINELFFDLKVDKIYSQVILSIQILIKNKRIFLGSRCGIVKEIVYCKNRFLFYLSNQRFQVKSGNSILTDLKHSFFAQTEIIQLKSNKYFLFALQEQQLLIYNIEGGQFNFLYKINQENIIQKLVQNRIFLQDKSDWEKSHFTMVDIQSLPYSINLILFTYYGIRLFLSIEKKDFTIEFIKFQASRNPKEMIISQFEESTIINQVCSNGINSFIQIKNIISNQNQLLYYQLNYNQEDQPKFQPSKNESVEFQDLNSEQIKMFMSQEFNYKQIKKQLKRQVDLISQIYLPQKKLFIFDNFQLIQYQVLRPVDRLESLINQLQSSDEKTETNQYFLNIFQGKQQNSITAQDQLTDKQFEYFIKQYGYLNTMAMLIQLYAQSAKDFCKITKKFKHSLLNIIESINKQTNLKLQGVILYLARVLRPFWQRKIMKDNQSNFEISELILLKKLIFEIQDFLKNMFESLQDQEKKTETIRFVKYVQECICLIIFLAENIGFMKIQIRLNKEEMVNLQEITFSNLITDSDQMRPLLRVFLKSRSIMDKSQIMKKNFPNYFSDQELLQYEAEILMNDKKIDQAQKILEKIQNISIKNILDYFHGVFVPNHNVQSFISILISQIQRKRAILKNQFLQQDKINQIQDNIEQLQNIFYDILEELIMPETSQQSYNEEVEMNGIFKGYRTSEISDIIKYILQNLNQINCKNFHINVFKLIIESNLSPYLKVVNSDYFMEIRNFIQQDPINILRAGQIIIISYTYYTEREQHYEAFLFSNDLFLIEQNEITEGSITLDDRKIYLFISKQNLENILKNEQNLQQRSMIQQNYNCILDKEKLLNLQTYVQDSLNRNQKYILENQESDEKIQDQQYQKFEQNQIQIIELEKKIYQKEYLINIIQKFNLFDCYLYFTEFQNFTVEFLQAIYFKIFLQIFHPILFKSRCMSIITQIQSNLRHQQKLHLFQILDIIQVVEAINLKNPIYKEYFTLIKQQKSQYNLKSIENCPFWFVDYLQDDLQISDFDILDNYSQIINKEFKEDELDKQIYFLIVTVAVIQKLINNDMMNHDFQRMKKILIDIKIQINSLKQNLQCDTELVQFIVEIIDNDLLDNIEVKLMLQKKLIQK